MRLSTTSLNKDSAHSNVAITIKSQNLEMKTMVQLDMTIGEFIKKLALKFPGDTSSYKLVMNNGEALDQKEKFSHYANQLKNCDVRIV